ncbi:hypothetical protein SAMN05192569_102932 [Parageobacillus thermantarcticus]|uniref:Uncharacterized protein n=1 Tax=Parageobacillus thermantarcticus TaxID=186116 RepID=A0A1I0THK5_9BACL|nr:hypothetical protein [Parageobacillus thermantarcticus]SFA51262.1 hypothetical protein SAMN05192569_102932 [Parageobacillus thermantarcticus]
MKRTLGIISLSLTLAFSINSYSFAAANNTTEFENIQINYEKDLGHENRTKDEIVRDLVNDGLSFEDAEYYAKLDILVNQLEKRNIEVNFDNTPDYSDQYVKAHKKELRDQALNLDKKALKAVLSKNKAMNQGVKDLNNVLDLMQEKYKDNKEMENRVIEIKYADGSSLIFNTGIVKEQEKTKEVKPQSTLLGGPWNKTADIDSVNATDNDGGTYRSTTSWSYVSGASYAKVTDVLRWSFNGKSDLTLSYLSDEGASSYAGVVTVDKEYRSNHKTGYNDDWHVVQGYTDVQFKVSGSFSASFKVLGISVNAGAGWHQYAITEAVRFPTTSEGAYGVYYYAGQYY